MDLKMWIWMNNLLGTGLNPCLGGLFLHNRHTSIQMQNLTSHPCGFLFETREEEKKYRNYG